MINGRKWFISGAADWGYCHRDGAHQRRARITRRRNDILIPSGTPGSSHHRDITTPDGGMFGGHSELIFDNVEVTDDAVLGEVDQVEVFAARYRELALSQAAEHGCLSPAAPRSATDLRRVNFVAADGKVARSPILKKTADRWGAQGRRIDATMHVQGGDAEQEVFGAKFWQATIRSGTDRNDRIIIDARRVPKRGYGGEAGIAVNALVDVARRAPACAAFATTARSAAFATTARSAASTSTPC